MSNGTSKIKNAITSLKEFFIFLREASIISIFLLILFFPITFNNVLTRAGFVEGNIGGFTWKNQLDKTDEALQKADMAIGQLEQELAESNKIIEELTAEVDAQKAVKLRTQSSKNTEVLKEVKRNDSEIQQTLQMNKSMLTPQQFRIDPLTLWSRTEWGVASGPYESLRQARNQQDRSARIYESRIFLRSGEYWVVLLSSHEEEAHELHRKLQGLNLPAEVVRLNEFCPNPAPARVEGVWSCGNESMQ